MLVYRIFRVFRWFRWLLIAFETVEVSYFSVVSVLVVILEFFVAYFQGKPTPDGSSITRLTPIGGMILESSY